MILKVYEVDRLLCPHCTALMKIVAFLTDFSEVDRIINHLKLRFVAETSAASDRLLRVPHGRETSAEYFS